MPEPESTPHLLQPDSYEAAAAARLRFDTAKKNRLFSLPSLSLLRKKHKTPEGNLDSNSNSASVSELSIERDSDTMIHLSRPPATNDLTEDVYVCKPNRMTLFSTPYYSPGSLLPSDPSPFTTPDAHVHRSHQPDVSLTQYPLPDGNFRWVSSTWMIDMQSDSGEVDVFGFQYNWFFRMHKWKAEVGKLSAGGWVRRRRWVRLMMKPGQPGKVRTASVGPAISSASSATGDGESPVNSLSQSFPPSVIELDGNGSQIQINKSQVWIGEDAQEDWARCRFLMKQLGRDGRKLELWQTWLGCNSVSPNSKDKAQTRDEQTFVQEEQPPSVELIAPVLRDHGVELLHSFVYPDSRAKFLAMLKSRDLLSEMNIGLASGELDFWSYTATSGEAI